MAKDNIKVLYSFEVKLTKDSMKETKTIGEGGKEIIERVPVKEEVPVKIVVKKPSRRDTQELQKFYGLTVSRSIRDGYLPKAFLAGQEPTKDFADTNLEFQNVQNELMRLNAQANPEENKEKKDELMARLSVLYRKMLDLETQYQSIFQFTAESIAKQKSLLWLEYFLSYIEEGDTHRELFKGKTFEDRDEFRLDLEEKEDPLYLLVIDRLSYILGLYLTGVAETEEEFKELDKEEAAQDEAVGEAVEEIAQEEVKRE